MKKQFYSSIILSVLILAPVAANAKAIASTSTQTKLSTPKSSPTTAKPSVKTLKFNVSTPVKLTKDNISSAKFKKVTSSKIMEHGIALHFSDGSFRVIDKPNFDLTPAQLNEVVEFVSEGLDLAVTNYSEVLSRGVFTDEYLINEIPNFSGLVEINEELLDAPEWIDQLVQVLVDYTNNYAVEVDVNFDMDSAITELKIMVGIDGFGNAGWNDLGGGLWGYDYGLGGSRSGEFYVYCETGDGDITYLSREDYDEDNDGKKDPDTSSWDDFWDWVAGKDREGDGIMWGKEGMMIKFNELTQPRYKSVLNQLKVILQVTLAINEVLEAQPASLQPQSLKLDSKTWAQNLAQQFTAQKLNASLKTSISQLVKSDVVSAIRISNVVVR